jgi:hypothetical protein
LNAQNVDGGNGGARGFTAGDVDNGQRNSVMIDPDADVTANIMNAMDRQTQPIDQLTISFPAQN